MIVLIALLALTAWAVPATVVAIARDGYRQLPFLADPDARDYESSRSA